MSISSLASSGWEGRSRSSSGRASSLGRNRRNRIGSPICRPPRQSSCTTSTTTTQQLPHRVLRPGAFRLRAVVQVVRAEHLSARASEQRVIDSQADWPVPLDEHRHQEVQQPQPELVGIPARAREEVMRTAVMPTASEPSGLQHPRHGAIPDTAGEPDHQHAERLKRRLREHRATKGQQTRERTGNLTHGGDPPAGQATGTLATPRGRWTCRPPDSGSPPLSPAQALKPPPASGHPPAITTPLSPPRIPKLENSG